jgi:cytochrome bd ubiquinol oxidase subunit I
MEDALLYDRLQFGFTISFHYLFPQLTMGLSLLLVWFKWRYLRTGNETYNHAAKFWMKIFALNFAMGVVTGIPMEFQFGTNWAKFSERTGGVIGQTLAMEGMFSFFLESSFLGLFLYGEKLLGQRLHFLSAFLIFLGSWLSGLLILATHSWMQHPVGYEIMANGRFALENFWSLLGNPWLWPSYLHNQAASLVTTAFVVTAVGALYLLQHREGEYGKLFVRTGVAVGLVASLALAFPTGDMLAKNVAERQPTTFAAMEGLFETETGAEIVLIGQPDMDAQRLDNKLAVPQMLSILTHHRWGTEVKGLNEFDKSRWPTNVPGLYYSYHIMVGLGTIFMGLMGLSAFLLWRRRLFTTRAVLWALMLVSPFAYIANLAGWYTAELGRQPWLVYDLMRTTEGASPNVSAGNALFTLLGFVGLYLLLGVLFLVLSGRLIAKGPAISPLTLEH